MVKNKIEIHYLNIDFFDLTQANYAEVFFPAKSQLKDCLCEFFKADGGEYGSVFNKAVETLVKRGKYEEENTCFMCDETTPMERFRLKLKLQIEIAKAKALAMKA